MEVTVKVYAENLKTGKVVQTNRAFVTYVALDDEGIVAFAARQRARAEGGTPSHPSRWMAPGVTSYM